MDYQFRDTIYTVVVELYDGTMSIVKNTNHMARISIDDMPDNAMRLFTHNGTLYIKSLTAKPAEAMLYIPDTVKEIKLKSRRADFILTELDVDIVDCVTMGDCSMHAVNIAKQCDLRSEGGDVSLQESTLRNMNVQLIGGTLETWNTILGGNNMFFTHNSNISFNLMGSEEDYVISAGSGIAPEKLIINNVPLSERSKNESQNAGWILMAGNQPEPISFTITE